MLKPGDLRHIAITSMMLQGYDRVEIERLSGHYEVNSHYSYANHMHYWIDTEIQILANQFKLQENTFVSPDAIDLFNNLSDDVLYTEIDNSESQTDEYIELELGYCKDVTMPCPTFNWEYTGCYFCENWWISHHELEKNKNRIVKELSTLYNDLHRKINYLSGLYNLHQLNKYGQINPDIQTELNQTTQEIKRDKITLAKLKYMLESEDL